jgi:hypothetical protein
MLNSYNQPNGFEAKVARQQETAGYKDASVEEPPKRPRKSVDPEKNNMLRQKINRGRRPRSESGA